MNNNFKDDNLLTYKEDQQIYPLQIKNQSNSKTYSSVPSPGPNPGKNAEKIPFWRIWLVSLGAAAFHIIILNIAAIIAGVILTIGSRPSSKTEFMSLLFSSDMQNLASIIMAMTCIPLYVLFLHYRNRKYKGSLSLKKIETKSMLKMTIAILGSLGLVTALLLLLDFVGQYVAFVAQWIQDYQELAEMIVSDQGNMLLQIIGTVIFVPIVEELLFRGIIMGELNFRYSPRAVVVLQALLFGMFHLNPLQSIYTFIPGLLLGIAYYYTGNLIAPILMHMVFNFFGGVLNFMVSEKTLTGITYIEMLLAIFTIFIIFNFFRKNETKPASQITMG